MKSGWQTKKLGDVCDFEGGSQPPKSEFIYEEKPGYVRFLQIRDFGSDKNITYIRHSNKNRLCNESDILIGRYGASVGKILTDKAGAYNVALMKTIPNMEVLDRSWFYNFLISDEFQRPLLNIAARSAQAGFSKDDINNFPVPVPPLSEQRRIVGILDKAFDGLATATANSEQNLRNARALFESHLQYVFTQRDKGWVERRLGEVVTRLTNGYVGPTRSIYLDSGVPYLLARHVKNNRLTFDGKTFISDEFNRKNKKSMLKTGDVLLVQSGHIGHSAVVTEEHEGHNCHAMIVITPVGSVVTGHFLSLYFNSGEMRQRFEEIRSGSTVPHLTCGAVKELTIALPDLPTQQRLVEGSQEMQAETQRLESIYQQKLAALEELKKSLLHQAFNGELTKDNPHNGELTMDNGQ